MLVLTNIPMLKGANIHTERERERGWEGTTNKDWCNDGLSKRNYTKAKQHLGYCVRRDGMNMGKIHVAGTLDTESSSLFRTLKKGRSGDSAVSHLKAEKE